MSQLSHDHPEKDDEGLERLATAQLLGLGEYRKPAAESTELERRECRDCAAIFLSKPSAPRTGKWYTLCPSCLQYEL